MTAAATTLPAIELAELVERAALQCRFDRKYVLPVEAADRLVEALSDRAFVLDIGGVREFGYESVYFDTEALYCYRLAARRRRRRFKIRTRLYVDSAECWLEVKTRGGRGDTLKNRLPYDVAHRGTIHPGREFVAGVLSGERIAVGHHDFAPVLVTRYRRTTLFLPETSSRVTVDVDLTWESTGGRVLRLPHLAIVETKTGSTASAADRLLWTHGHRPARVSKFATGLAALHPGLPATPWWRTLRRHFPRTEGVST
ncbi:VTC domain-containing protein [Virgisporangium aliadipatigenens]|uniref:VTC domain-containing protein n=1 Tax=Virgisporangium aliadipatigenens TaxID=741659 RepID=A0A8J3YLD0_9ACTN|nr:polyphosphate polymerase domain-containing protein [Virgisporangium aliadipatigenens]GIJ45996.1 VTC domain-containing protein [Virgisporangium aliadipatigenens]